MEGANLFLSREVNRGRRKEILFMMCEMTEENFAFSKKYQL